MQLDTVSNIVSDAAIGVGLVSSTVSNPYASTDDNILRMCTLLTELGQQLARERAWTQLQKTHTFSTANGTASYALPTDFDRLADGSQWNRTQQLPLAGPASPQVWQLFKAQTSTGVVDKFLRIYGNLFYLHPTPTAIETVAFDYQSFYWVMPSGQTVPTTAAPTANTDTLWFDRLLLVRGLKLAHLRASGFDSSGAQRDYEDTRAAVSGGDGAAPTLSLNRGSCGVTRLLDGNNVPLTGFGS